MFGIHLTQVCRFEGDSAYAECNCPLFVYDGRETPIYFIVSVL